MKIGIFDSGVGGLIITHALIEKLPLYDYIYLGDLARVPYGNRSVQIIYQFTEQAVAYLFKQNCQLIIVACNTASAAALRKIQEAYLPNHYPTRRVLGVLIPAAEIASTKTKNHRIGILATNSTVSSGAFISEINKLSPQTQVFQSPAPLLVPLIENDGLKWASSILDEYLAPLLKYNIDTLVLGCTHYPLLKDIIRVKVGNDIEVICQDEIIPAKLKVYLTKHPEIETSLSKKSERTFYVTDLTNETQQLAKKLFGEQIVNLKKINP